jgi:small ligand-binding sensory domain FIST
MGAVVDFRKVGCRVQRLPRRPLFRTQRSVKWCSALSTDDDIVSATRSVVDTVHAGMGPQEPNLVLLFVSDGHAEHYGEVAALVGGEFPAALIIGCTARGVIGGGLEIESSGALSLTAAALPGVSLNPFHLDAEELPEAERASAFWSQRFGGLVGEDPCFLLLADPFSMDVEAMVRGLEAAFPGAPAIGGLASGGGAPGENALYIGSDVHRSGAVGIALSGNILLETVVAQGCRPVGLPMFVTRARENILFELDGRPALQVANEVIESLCESDQMAAHQALLLGLGMGDGQGPFGQGDFLMRNLVGKDEPSGSLLVGAMLDEKQVVQFQLRDATAAREELQASLSQVGGGFAGAVLLSCLGRGEGLYGCPNHDSDQVRARCGDIPVAGFFAEGEVGPVGGETFVHGYTSVIGLFRSRDAETASVEVTEGS